MPKHNRPFKLLALSVSLFLFMGAALALTGCKGFQKQTEESIDLPAYADFAAKHNNNATKLDQLWSRCTVAMRWVDEDGDLNTQQAEGNFFFRGERDIALRVAKLDNVIFWFGSNADEYWLIDRYQVPPTIYVGTHVKDRQTMPMGLPVTDMLQLAAVRPIAETGTVSLSDEGLIAIQPDGQPLTLYLDPEHQLPVKTTLTRADGTVLATCLMDQFDRVDVPGINPLEDPHMAKRLVVKTPDNEGGSLTLVLDGMRHRGVSDVQFDRERLQKAFPTERTVDLDQQP